MNISITCTHCQKQYNAPASLAGKRVKCKHCAQVFAIPAVASVDDTPPGFEIEAPEITPVHNKTPAPFRPVPKAPAAPVDQEAAPEVSTSPQPPLAKSIKKIDRKNDVADIPVDSDEPDAIIYLRPTLIHDFTGAVVMDRFLAPVSLVLGLGLLSMLAINSNNTGHIWVGVTRLCAYLFCYCAIVFPMGWFAVARSAMLCRFQMPPAPVFRTFSLMAFPFALVIACWLGGQSITALVIGIFFASAFLAAMVWLLFRLQQQDIPTTLPTTLGAFIASIITTMLVLGGINMIFASSFHNAPENNLASSPIGPTFSWDVPIKTAPKKPLVKLDPSPVTQPAKIESPSIIPSTSPAIISPVEPATKPIITPATQPIIATTIPVEPTTKMATTAPVKPVETIKPTIATTVDSPLVASITPFDVGAHEQLIFQTVGTSHFAIVRTEGELDRIEQWTLNPPVKKSATHAPFAHPKDNLQHYALSSTGDQLAIAETWPELCVQIYSFSQQKIIRKIPLSPEFGTIELLGFAANDVLIVLRSKEAKNGIELWTTRQPVPQRLGAFDLPVYEPGPSSLVINPDGRLLALTLPASTDNVIPPATPKGAIVLYDLTSNRRDPVRTIIPAIQTWVKPSGVCFSPDGRMIAALFELDNKGLVVGYNLATPQKPAFSHPYLALPWPASAPQNFGLVRGFDWLGDGKGWLVYGNHLLDQDTGIPLGNLGLKSTTFARIIDKETLLVRAATTATNPPDTTNPITPGAPAPDESSLAIIKLKPEALTAARKAPR